MSSGSEHLDALRKEYMAVVNQVQSQRAEVLKSKEELHAMQAQLQSCQETLAHAQMEIGKNTEIGKRLQQTITGVLHMIPGEYQAMVMQEMEKIRQLQPNQNDQIAAAMMSAMVGGMAGGMAGAAGMPAAMAGGMANPMMGLRNAMIPPMGTASPRVKPNGMPNGIPSSVMGVPHGIPPGMQMMAGQPFPGMHAGLPPQFAHPMMMQQMAQQLGMSPSLNVNVSTPSRTHSNGPLSGARTTPVNSTQSPRPHGEMKQPNSVPDRQSHTPLSSHTPIESKIETVVKQEDELPVA